MAANPVYTLSEIAQHKSKKDCWLVIDGRVLNVTKFLEEHPGGEEVLMEVAGKDATKEFKDIGHSKAAHDLLLKYQVGLLHGYSKKDADHVQAGSADEPTIKKEVMSAFVIKDNAVPKYAAIAEFVVPLLVAASYFSYRYLTTTSSMV